MGEVRLAEVNSLFDQKYSNVEKVEALEDSVNDVKLLFEQKYGWSIDDVDDDGTLWIKTGEIAEPQDAYDNRLAGLEARLAEAKTLYDQKYSHDEKVESLEESVQDVKLLFEKKYGCSVDEIDDNEKYSYAEKVEALEDSVNGVKLLFEQKYGCSIDCI